MVLWTPNGSIIRNELQNFIIDELIKSGYEQVFTPHIGKLGFTELPDTSPTTKSHNFPPVVEPGTIDHWLMMEIPALSLSKQLDEGSVDGYLLKPMNCPMHIKIFDSQPHSYRDLPSAALRVWNCLPMGTVR